MRTLKELYEMLLGELLLREYAYKYEQGICEILSFYKLDGLITYEEWKIVSTDFRSKKPCWYSKFYWNNNCNLIRGDYLSYWWSLDKEGLIQRQLFIKHIIKKLK